MLGLQCSVSHCPSQAALLLVGNWLMFCLNAPASTGAAAFFMVSVVVVE